MKHVVPGKEITRADGRRMVVERVATAGEIRVVWWREIPAFKAAG